MVQSANLQHIFFHRISRGGYRILLSVSTLPRIFQKKKKKNFVPRTFILSLSDKMEEVLCVCVFKRVVQ